MSDQLNQKELKLLQTTFNEIDKDKDRKISKSELKEAMKRKNIPYNELFDHNGDGLITFERICQILPLGKIWWKIIDR